MTNDDESVGGGAARAITMRFIRLARRQWARWAKRRSLGQATSIQQRFQSRIVVDPKTGCHLWNGYGRQPYGKITLSTHRLAWELTNGPIPEGLQVNHRCDNPTCCNPEHLFLGTQAENMADMWGKGRGPNQIGKKAGRFLRRRSRARRLDRPSDA